MRKVVWFSCGAPSAVAAKLCVNQGPCLVAYVEIKEEHPDNQRFITDVEQWIGQPVTIIGNDKYDRSIYEVFSKRNFLNGRTGAPCTTHLKMEVRKDFQRPDDIHVLGFTAEEQERMDDFKEAFPELTVECPLIERGLRKADCLAMVADAGIEIPAMYRLGYNNNNCIGCVKGGIGYWNKIRVDFPATFERMAREQRRLNYTLHRIDEKPVFLDELPPDAGRDVPEPKIDCSIMCAIAKQEYSS